jgi:hypothetical protein
VKGSAGSQGKDVLKILTRRLLPSTRDIRAACCPTCHGVTSSKRTANREIDLLRVGN